ncbi:RNA polymerase sigma-70 factor [Parapedobacter sp. ISTM3]|uniref:RNA polymerase sigma-70 factor, ECF subfamily n=1 Tax=Parapedobacter luteus TaxID=623280 RepID=A0A1T5AKY1_9SPHI|nr:MULTISPECIES: RNA polymerase sigma-70 factor [Parapedobacter]MBK1441716.1 RNA polymerase sigma-70 factor [Parapedobacter sp. ISTM3]SKB35489.1 RNA polymerase sigma-70 factor, ECF subfamily [Parapedobacter luteus]
MSVHFNERVVLEELKAGSEQAFEKIYFQFWESLFNHTYQRVKNEDEAKELIQDLFTDLWHKRHSLDIRTSLNAYLHAAIRYKLFKHTKLKIAHENYASNYKHVNSANSTGDRLDFNELNQAFERALASLPLQPRRVFELKYYQGMSYLEIANSLHISISTVEKHMIKALKRIRKQIKRFSAC